MIFLIVIFIIVCGLLMLSILLQSGKGEGLSGTFGGAGSQFMGGRAAATFLTKTTTTLAATFMFLSILLSVWGPRMGRRAVESEAQRRLKETAPAQVAPLPQQQQAPGQQVPAPTRGR